MSFPTEINTAVDEGFEDNVVEMIAQEAAGALPVEDDKVRIKQNYFFFIKVNTVPNVTEIIIVWGLDFGLILLGAVHVAWHVYIMRIGRSRWLMARRPFREQICSHDHRPIHPVVGITRSA